MTILEKRSLISSLVVLSIYLLPSYPYLFDTKYLVHDFLNSNVVWFKVLGESEMLFSGSSSILPNMLGGVPRGCFPSQFNISVLLFSLMKVKNALFIHHALIHLVAFFGMRLLLKILIVEKYFDVQLDTIINVASLSFAVLPFWTPAGLSVAGQPIFFASLISIYRAPNLIKWYLLLIALSFWVGFIFSGLFMLITASAVFLLQSIANKTWNWGVVIALALFALFQVIVEYRLFEMQFIHELQSQRVPNQNTGTISFRGYFGIATQLFLFGQYHAHSFAIPFVFIIGFLIYKGKSRIKILLSILPLSLLIFTLTSLLLLKDLMIFNQFFDESSYLNQIQLRFYTVLPVFWYFIFGVVLSQCNHLSRRLYFFLLLSLILVCSTRIFNFTFPDYQGNRYVDNRFYSTLLSRDSTAYQSVDRYYMTSFFLRLKQDYPQIQREKKIIACIDLEPQKAQFNGFPTIGGYYAYYPMENKKRFLSYSEEHYKQYNPSYLDQINNWGSQLYFRTEPALSEPLNVKFDFNEMNSDGCELVLSKRTLTDESLELVADYRGEFNDGFLLYTIQRK